MILEDDQPRPSRAAFTPPVLDGWGIEELQRYIASLEAEIARAAAAIAARTAHRGAADAMFRAPQDSERA